MKKWEAQYSRGVGAITRNADSTWSFDFPQQDGVHYVVRQFTKPATRFTLEAQVKTLSGNPVFKALGGGTPALRMFFTNGDMASEDGRWWSNPSKLDLVPGLQVMTIGLEPRLWSQVNGKPGNERIKQFTDCVRSIGGVGFTFGGKFFGHGVYATGGKARFTFKHKVA